jgi:hypothetical protein
VREFWNAYDLDSLVFEHEYLARALTLSEEQEEARALSSRLELRADDPFITPPPMRIENGS